MAGRVKKPSPPPAPLLPDLTLREVAHALHVHRNTVEHLIKLGLLHPYKVGRRYRFTRDELLRFRTEHATHPSPLVLPTS